VLTTVELLIVETPGWDLARTFDPTTGYTELVVKASER
jgi:predicted DNA-binding protein with PD1-like motif